MPNVLICVATLSRSTVEVYDVPGDRGAMRRIHDCGILDSPADVGRALAALLAHFPHLHLAVFYGPFGGTSEDSPVVVDDELLKRLDELSPRAPTTLPAIGVAMRALATNYRDVPRVFAFGSGFFSRLPQRERFYAIEPAEGRRLGLERTGFHGLFHAASVAGIRAGDGVRTLSICLEPNPEAAAILDDRPMMVTGGATPLEGLPGQTTCGEIDPGMVLILAQEQHWSPEQIAEALTRESGLLGLTGQPTDLSELFASDGASTQLARDMMLYRLQLTTGMAIAALGGLDRIVFSGRHAAAGEVIGAWLLERLEQLPGGVRPLVEFNESTFVELVVHGSMSQHLMITTSGSTDGVVRSTQS